MSITLIRVINEQKIERSILVDKLDDGQANVEGYAQYTKQKVYIPYTNPADPLVKGYIDLVPTDRVLLSADRGTIKGLADGLWITSMSFSSSLITTAVVMAAANAVGATTIDGTTFASLTPDVTYVIFENLVGGIQVISQAAFTSITPLQIVVPDVVMTIGIPGPGWKCTVKANSKLSNTLVM